MLLCIINCKSILRGCWHRWSGETGKITVLSLYTKLKGIFAIVAVAKSLQSCLTLCDPIDGSPRLPHPWDSPGKNTGVGCHFLLQCMKVKSESELLSCVRLLAIPWTAAYQAPPSMGFYRQEYWSGVPLSSPSLLKPV